MMTNRLPINAIDVTGADATNDTPRFNPATDRLEFAPGGATSQTVRETFTADANDAELTLGATPIGGRVYLWLDGLLLVPAIDYTVDGGDPTKYTLTNALTGGETLHISWETLDPAPTASTLVAGAATGYPAEVLADSPLFYWRLGEAAGSSVAVDASGNGRNGSCNAVTFGATGLLTGDTDTCADFTAPSSVVAIAGGSAWINPPTFTFEALFTADSVTGNHVIGGRIDGTTSVVWMLRLDGASLVFYVNTNGSSGWVALTAAGAITAGTKYHAAATYDGTTRRIFLNGSQVASAAGGVTPFSTNTPGLSVGRWYDQNTEPFDGRIDEVAYYGTALSSTRIAAHAAAA